jgi:hypothetical protein
MTTRRRSRFKARAISEDVDVRPAGSRADVNGEMEALAALLAGAAAEGSDGAAMRAAIDWLSRPLEESEMAARDSLPAGSRVAGALRELGTMILPGSADAGAGGDVE